MPLIALTKKNNQTGQPVTFEWNNKYYKESFQKIKNVLCSSPVLIPPDLDKEIFLWVDACEDGFGATLEQMGVDNLRHMVAHANQAINDAEKKYVSPHQTRDGSNCNHFEVYLLGHKIIVFTDHQALVTGYVLLERSIKRTTVQVVFKSFSVSGADPEFLKGGC